MELVRWNPWREATTLQHRFNKMFNDTMFPVCGAKTKAEDRSWHPAVDVYENDEHIMIKAELPGIEKKDIDIDVNDRVLTLKGERSFDNEVKEDKFYRRERVFGNFTRSFALPPNVDSAKIEADFKDGVLSITVPKPESEQPKKITVH